MNVKLEPRSVDGQIKADELVFEDLYVTPIGLRTPGGAETVYAWTNKDGVGHSKAIYIGEKLLGVQDLSISEIDQLGYDISGSDAIDFSRRTSQRTELKRSLKLTDREFYVVFYDEYLSGKYDISIKEIVRHEPMDVPKRSNKDRNSSERFTANDLKKVKNISSRDIFFRDLRVVPATLRTPGQETTIFVWEQASAPNRNYIQIVGLELLGVRGYSQDELDEIGYDVRPDYRLKTDFRIAGEKRADMKQMIKSSDGKEFLMKVLRNSANGPKLEIKEIIRQ